MASVARVVVVEPARRWPKPNLRALWLDRELIYFIGWRDVKIRYKQALIGFGWAVFQPLISMLAFTLAFSKLTQVPSEGIPYPVFVLAGLVPWTYFSNAVTWGSQSLVGNVQLVTKVYFPRLVLPVSGVLTWVVDLFVSLILLFIMMAIYGVPFRPTILLIPVLVIAVAVTALSVSLWLAALNVKYRDIRYALTFLIQIWLFATPVIYPASVLPEGTVKAIYSLNPMVGVVESFKWALIGTSPPDANMWPSLLVVVALLVTGFVYFGRTEQSFADVI